MTEKDYQDLLYRYDEYEIERMCRIAPVCFLQLAVQHLIGLVLKQKDATDRFFVDIKDFETAVNKKLDKNAKNPENTEKVTKAKRFMKKGYFQYISSRVQCQKEMIEFMEEVIHDNCLSVNFKYTMPELDEFFAKIDPTQQQKDFYSKFIKTQNQLFSSIGTNMNCTVSRKIIKENIDDEMFSYDSSLANVVYNLKIYTDALANVADIIKDDYHLNELGSVEEAIQISDALVEEFDYRYGSNFGELEYFDSEEKINQFYDMIEPITTNKMNSIFWVSNYADYDVHDSVECAIRGVEPTIIYS